MFGAPRAEVVERSKHGEDGDKADRPADQAPKDDDDVAQVVTGIVDHPVLDLMAEDDDQRSQPRGTSTMKYQHEAADAAAPEGPAFGRKPIGAAKSLHEGKHDAEAGKQAQPGGGENNRAGMEMVREDGGLHQIEGIGGHKLLEDDARFAGERGPSSTWATSVVMTSRAGKNMSMPE